MVTWLVSTYLLVTGFLLITFFKTDKTEKSIHIRQRENNVLPHGCLGREPRPKVSRLDNQNDLEVTTIDFVDDFTSAGSDSEWVISRHLAVVRSLLTAVFDCLA